jgi:hypothetical protein
LSGAFFAAVLLAILFAFGLRMSSVMQLSREAIGVARSTVDVLIARDRSDAEKERIARAGAARLLAIAAVIAGRGAAILVAPAAVGFVICHLGLVDSSALLLELQSWRLIIIASVAATVALLV